MVARVARCRQRARRWPRMEVKPRAVLRAYWRRPTHYVWKFPEDRRFSCSPASLSLQDVKADIDGTAAKTGLAIAKVIFPQPAEFHIETQRRHFAIGIQETPPPFGQRRGITRSEAVDRLQRQRHPLGLIGNDRPGGQQPAGKDVMLDEIAAGAIGCESVLAHGDDLQHRGSARREADRKSTR